MGVTVRDVRAAVARYESACREAGLIRAHERIALDEGSATYGRAWRVAVTDVLEPVRVVLPETERGRVTHSGSTFIAPTGWRFCSGHYSPPGTSASGFLGVTKAEAQQTLHTIVRTIWDMGEGQRPRWSYDAPAVEVLADA